jgi:DNA-binding transcriptional regulator Cro
MKRAALLDHFGSVERTAAAFGVSKSAVYQWPEDVVPERIALQAQLLTGGVLRADQALYEARRAEIAAKRTSHRRTAA